jgi:RNA polymerase sigma-70 factor (ECF subfamily)
LADLATLVERCRRGDDLAWEAFVRRFQARIYGLAFHYLRDSEEARDVAQEIFIQIYRKLDSFRENENPVPWILRVGRNLCIDRLRRLKARPPAVDIPAEEASEEPLGTIKSRSNRARIELATRVRALDPSYGA